MEMLGEGLASAGCIFHPIDRPSDGVVDAAAALLIQWPDQIFWRRDTGPFSQTLKELWALSRWKRQGKRIIWVVHNIKPHELEREDRLVWQLLTSGLSLLVDGFMTLGSDTRGQVLDAFPLLRLKPVGTFWHPAYTNVIRPTPLARMRREALGIKEGDRLIGSLGTVGDYKGLPELIHIFRKLEQRHFRLLIAGLPRTPKARDDVLAAASDDQRIILHLDHMTENLFAENFAACDRHILPYRDYLHSGSIVYAACGERPLLTPVTPFALQYSKIVGRGWITCYDGMLSTKTLQNFIEGEAPSKRPNLEQLEPGQSGEAIASFVREISQSR